MKHSDFFCNDRHKSDSNMESRGRQQRRIALLRWKESPVVKSGLNHLGRLFFNIGHAECVVVPQVNPDKDGRSRFSKLNFESTTFITPRWY